jgi:toxin ParE1/3/4
MAYEVLLTEDAARDLEEIHGFILENDSAAAAAKILDGLEKALGHLENLPERGAYLKDLIALGIKDFRFVYFKPYKIIYRVSGESVLIYLVADGRRDMQNLLARRLLSA